MRSFLVERCLATHDPAALEAVRRRAAATAVESRGVRYLGSLVLPEDEVCFHVFQAASLAVLIGASERAELGVDRVVETVWLAAEPG